MSASQSFLSNPKYGYDFVVATTQASINSGLLEYLSNSSQPETIVCFLADEKGNPTTMITLAELTAKTGGISPFDIPNGTPYNDPRITTLTQNMFVVGLKIKMGLPPGILPKNLPPVLDLGSSANNVNFNLFCSEFEIIQNSPPSGFGASGSWNVWSQPAGTAWYFKTVVNLVYSDLNNELNTPYFNSHPAEKQALLNQLQNLNSGAFSLQQLLFDLDNAALMGIPSIQGIDPSSDAGVVLTKSFTNLYFAAVQAEGLPIISVHAVANAPDNSSLRLTGIEREVGPLLDGNGVVIPTPTPAQKQAYTLEYLCAANNNPLPGIASFNWNWIDPADIDNMSGVISINRNTLGTYYKNVLMPIVSRSCLKPWTSITAHMMGSLDTSYSLTPYQTPQSAVISDSGPTVLTISYASNADNNDKSGLTYGELDLHSSYSCTVSFSGNTITIVQNLLIYLYVEFDYTSASGNVVNTTITDTFTLSVDQNGNLVSTHTTASQDNSQSPDFGWFMKLISTFQNIPDGVKAYAQNVASLELTGIPAQSIQSFVFPGAKVFTYKNVAFSDNQDLVTAITYVTPS